MNIKNVKATKLLIELSDKELFAAVVTSTADIMASSLGDTSTVERMLEIQKDLHDALNYGADVQGALRRFFRESNIPYIGVDGIRLQAADIIEIHVTKGDTKYVIEDKDIDF